MQETGEQGRSSIPDLALTSHHIFIGGQLLKTHRAPGVNFICANSNFGTKPNMRPSNPWCCSVTWAIEGRWSFGMIKKCTGAQGAMS